MNPDYPTIDELLEGLSSYTQALNDIAEAYETEGHAATARCYGEMAGLSSAALEAMKKIPVLAFETSLVLPETLYEEDDDD